MRSLYFAGVFIYSGHGLPFIQLSFPVGVSSCNYKDEIIAAVAAVTFIIITKQN